MHGPEGSSPPLPYIEVEDAHAERLIARKLAEEVSDEEPSVESPAAPVEEPAKTEEPPAGGPAEGGPASNKVEDDRETLIRDALDLVEADGRDEAGKPTAKAIEEITGLANVTVEEIDAALAAHAAA